MPYRGRVDPSLFVLLGGAALLIPACTSLLGTFELGPTGAGGGGATSSSSSSSDGSGGGSSSSSETSTGAGGGDPGSGTPSSASVVTPLGANDFAHPTSVSARLGIIAVGGSFSGQFHLASFDTVCPKAKSCGFVTRFDISSGPGPHKPWGIALAGDGASDTAVVRSVAVDSKGFVFVGGSYSGSLHINGSSPLPSFQDGVQHAFVTRLNANPSPQWALVSMTAGPSVITSVALDPNDNPIVAGNFTESISLGICAPLTIAPGTTSSFVTKLAGVDAGCMWSTGLFGADVTINSVASDPDGNAVVTGSHAASAKFLGGVMLSKSASPGGDLFVAKLHSAEQGLPLWFRDTRSTLGAAGASGAYVQDAAGKFGVVVTGQLTGTAFPGTPCAVTAPPGASSLVARLDNAKGDCVWARSFAGNSAAVAVDGKGDLTLTGSFLGKTALDATHVLDSGPDPGTFVGKLGSIAGAHRWSRALIAQNAGESITATSVSGDPGSGEWFVVGDLDGTTDFGVGPPLGTTKGGFLVHLGN
jgi:hypothetical protein